MRFRKQEEMTKNLQANQINTPKKILTSCPSCLQGLERIGQDNELRTDYVVVELAKNILGENWMKNYLAKAKDGAIEQVLL